MTDITPFADDAASADIGGLTVENGTHRVTLYGTLELTRDRQGLGHARALKALADAVVARLEADAALPDAVLPAPAAKTVKNPFA